MPTKSIALILFTASLTIATFAQTTETIQSGQVTAVAPAHAPGVTMAFRTQMLDTAPVKGVPFCATVTNDHLQTFADGNRIHTSDTSMVCRDSQGRMRREAQLDLLGAVPDGDAPKLITITDPVAGVRYTLDTFAKVARKSPLNEKVLAETQALKPGPNAAYMVSKSLGPEGPAPEHGGPGQVVIHEERLVRNGAMVNDSGPSQTESLGDQTIAGVRATGTKITTTIPAGKMGNDQPINIVSERWYSPDLQATVMTKHSDPWAGQLTTQFSNINTAEPDPSLFTVPSDYKIVEEKDGPFMIKLPPHAE